MLVNSSSSWSAPYSSLSGAELVYFCSSSRAKSYILNVFYTVKSFLVIPFCAFVLFLGLRRWRRERSLKSLSHSDVFTFHLSLLEMLWFPGFLCQIWGVYVDQLDIIMAGSAVLSFIFYGEGLFHVLTCADRYLAVVHPVLYLGLRSSRGVLIRDVGAALVWVFSFGFSFMFLDASGRHILVALMCFLSVPISAVTFCSVSVLCVLIRPGPGGGGPAGDGKQTDQLKRRAFHTIAAILAVLWLWFLGLIVGSSLSRSGAVKENDGCLVLAILNWLNLPVSLASPLLYLHRVGKLTLTCCRRQVTAK